MNAYAMSAVTDASERPWSNFSAKFTTCPKCTSRYCTPRYHGAKFPGVTVDGCYLAPEHLHVTCASCGYWWPCKTRDSA